MNTDKPMIFSFLGNKAFDACIETLKNEYKSVCESRDDLRKQLESWNKDEEIQTLRRVIDNNWRLSLLQLSENEVEYIESFKNRHRQLCKNGSCYQYELSGAGVGTAIKIRCPKCGEERDVTDYTSW